MATSGLMGNGWLSHFSVLSSVLRMSYNEHTFLLHSGKHDKKVIIMSAVTHSADVLRDHGAHSSAPCRGVRHEWEAKGAGVEAWG